jgi:hypothetical protein
MEGPWNYRKMPETPVEPKKYIRNKDYDGFIAFYTVVFLVGLVTLITATVR